MFRALLPCVSASHVPTCRACPVRQARAQANDAPRHLTVVRPRAQPEALQAARPRQETAECTDPYAPKEVLAHALSCLAEQQAPAQV